MNTHLTARPGRLRATAVLALASALLLAGCGNDERGPEGTAATVEPSASASASPGSTPTPGGTLDAAAVTGEDDLGTTPQEDVFDVTSPWNQRIVDARVAKDSESLLENSKIRTLVDVNGETTTEAIDDGVYVNTRAWTVPVVADGVPTLVTCRQITCGDGGKDLTLDIPADIDPDPLYDGWFTVFDPASDTAYDLWRARREDDGTISYHFMRTWKLDGPGYNDPYVVSARGSGLPLFAGLIRPGELERCQINHALAISVPGPAAGYFLQPASSTDGNNLSDKSLPEGARIRLDAGFQLERPVDPVTKKALPFNKTRQKYAGCIIRALQTYGAIVVDRAAVPTLYFQRVNREKGRSPLLNGWELSSLGLEDFSVIDFSGRKRWPFPGNAEATELLPSGEDTQTTTSLGTQAEGQR